MIDTWIEYLRMAFTNKQKVAKGCRYCTIFRPKMSPVSPWLSAFENDTLFGCLAGQSVAVIKTFLDLIISQILGVETPSYINIIFEGFHIRDQS